MPQADLSKIVDIKNYAQGSYKNENILQLKQNLASSLKQYCKELERKCLIYVRCFLQENWAQKSLARIFQKTGFSCKTFGNFCKTNKINALSSKFLQENLQRSRKFSLTD